MRRPNAFWRHVALLSLTAAPGGLTGCGTGELSQSAAPYDRGVCIAEPEQCDPDQSNPPLHPLSGSLGAGASGSYAVTAVADNLDSGDLDIVADGLQRLGLGQAQRDMDVSHSSLAAYLGQPTTVVYHTGHGTLGGVHTADGGPVLTAASVDIQAAHTIFATCLTLADESWRDALAPRARGLFGYTDKSFDKPTDDEVARSWIREIGQGRDPLQAWYLANANVSLLSDRWAAYIREPAQGSAIVEYSARTAAAPKTRSTARWLALGSTGGLRVAEHLLSGLPEPPRLQRSLRLVAGSLPATHIASEGPLLLADSPAPSRSEAESIAMAWLDDHGGLPADAFFDRATAVEASLDDGQRQVVAYAVRFGRVRGGLTIRGNGIEDHITILVTAAGVAAASQYWPEMRAVSVSDTPAPTKNALQVLDLAADEIVRALKGGTLSVDSIELVLGTGGPYRQLQRLVPAYLLRGAEGSNLVVDASTGMPL